MTDHDIVNEVEEGSIAAAFLDLSGVEEETDTKEPDEPHQDSLQDDGQPEEEPESETTVEDEGDEPESDDEAEGEATDDEEPEEDDAQEKASGSFELPDGSKVTQQELIDGFMRNADYSRKTAELAEQRKAGEVEIQEVRDQQTKILEALVQQFEVFDPRAPYAQALQEAREDGDTERANELQLHINGMTQQMERFYNAYQHDKGEEQQKQGKTKEQQLQYHKQALLEKMPELTKPEKVKEFQEATARSLKRFGYSDDEIKGMDAPDHRDAMAYYYADKYFELSKKMPKSAEKLKGKAVTPQTQARKSNKNTKRESALKQFNKNPNAEGSLAGLLLANGI